MQNLNTIDPHHQPHFNIKEEVEKYLIHWKWFLVGLLLALSCAFLYLRYSIPKYKAVATILVKDDRKGNMASELSAFSDFSMGAAYTSEDGSLSQNLPFDISDDTFSVSYENIPGWNVPLDEVTDWNNLPKEATDYLLKLEKELNVPITMVSVGPGRDQLIVK